MNGPEMSADRAALNSSIAFLCASVSADGAIGGMRSWALAAATPERIEHVTSIQRIYPPDDGGLWEATPPSLQTSELSYADPNGQCGRLPPLCSTISRP